MGENSEKDEHAEYERQDVLALLKAENLLFGPKGLLSEETLTKAGVPDHYLLFAQAVNNEFSYVKRESNRPEGQRAVAFSTDFYKRKFDRPLPRFLLESGIYGPDERRVEVTYDEKGTPLEIELEVVEAPNPEITTD